jgi:hypothetical protein
MPAQRIPINDASMRQLAYLATLIAVEAPAKRSKYSVAASIRWTLIEDIRNTLWAAGYPIDETIKHARELAKEGRANP